MPKFKRGTQVRFSVYNPRKYQWRVRTGYILRESKGLVYIRSGKYVFTKSVDNRITPIG